MAFANGTIWHGWSSGATDFGGGFDPTSANFATDLTTDANTGNTSSPVVSSASYNFTANDVGHWLFIQSGTNWTPGWYQIASVASNKATLTAGIGTAILYGTNSIKKTYHRPDGLNTVAGVATVGTPTGGVWGIDYSQSTTNRITYTDMVIDGVTNTIFTSAGNPVGKNIIGNIINVTSGGGFTVQRVQIVSTTGTQATVDKSLGTLGSTGGNGKLGGAIGSTSVVTALTQTLTAGNKVFLKGLYTLTSTTTTISTAIGDQTNGRIFIEGFANYPGDMGTPPEITSATNSVALITCNNADYWDFTNIKFSHTATTRGNAFAYSGAASNPQWFTKCIFDGCLGACSIGTAFTTFTHHILCEFKNCTSTVINCSNGGTQYVYGCYFHNNTGAQVFIGGAFGQNFNLQIQDSILYNNAMVINTNNSGATGTGIYIRNCVFAGNSGDVIKMAATTSSFIIALQNSVFYNNGGYAINMLDDLNEILARLRINRGNAYGSNTSGNFSNAIGGIDDEALTTDPFWNAAGGNFAPNKAAGGGLLLRSTGFPGIMPGGISNDAHDIGVQHPDDAQPVFMKKYGTIYKM